MMGDNMKHTFSKFLIFLIILGLNLFTMSACSKNNITLKIHPFSSTLIDSIHDEYIELTINNNIYHQISAKDLNDYRLGNTIAINKLGEYIGKVEGMKNKNHNNLNSNFIVSSEPTLNGAEAYYAPTDSEALVFVIKDERCSAFILSDFDNSEENSYYLQLFKSFGVTSYEDIKRISYEKWNGEYDTNNTAILVTGEISSGDDIKKIFEILVSNDKKNLSDSKLTRPHTVMLTLYLTNNLIIGKGDDSIKYYPFNGNGMIEIKGELSEEQNAILMELFDIK